MSYKNPTGFLSYYTKNTPPAYYVEKFANANSEKNMPWEILVGNLPMSQFGKFPREFAHGIFFPEFASGKFGHNMS